MSERLARCSPAAVPRTGGDSRPSVSAARVVRAARFRCVSRPRFTHHRTRRCGRRPHGGGGGIPEFDDEGDPRPLTRDWVAEMLREATEEKVEQPEPAHAVEPAVDPIAPAAAPSVTLPLEMAGTIEVRPTVVPAFRLVAPEASIEVEPSVEVATPLPAVAAAPV